MRSQKLNAQCKNKSKNVLHELLPAALKGSKIPAIINTTAESKVIAPQK